MGLVGCPAASLAAFSLSRASCPFFAAQYAESAKGNEATVYEEYAAKVFAHQYGTEAEQKLIAEFVKDNIPGFPIEEYTKQMKALDEL